MPPGSHVMKVNISYSAKNVSSEQNTVTRKRREEGYLLLERGWNKSLALRLVAA